MGKLGSASIERQASPQRSGTMHRWILAILLLLGMGGWFYFFDDRSFLILGPWSPGFLGIFALVLTAAAWIPPVRSLVNRLFSTFQFPYAIAAGAMSALYLLVTAHQQRRSRLPYLHDEFSYLIQAHQLAIGRLWMTAHPIGEFFDSFQLFVRPVYASIYFPGTAILYVPGVWLHLPAWVTP